MAAKDKCPGHEHFYGAVVVGERGQVVIPKEARDNMGIVAGARLIVLDAQGKGVLLVKADNLREMAEHILAKVK